MAFVRRTISQLMKCVPRANCSFRKMPNNINMPENSPILSAQTEIDENH